MLSAGAAHRAIAVAIATASLSLAGAQAAEKAAQPQRPVTAADWRSVAASDVEQAHAITLDNHPGVHDPSNPRFAERLQHARAEALRLAAAIDSPDGYRAVIARFTAVLGDGHAGAFATVKPSGAPQWPGFLTVWRGQDLWVYASESAVPAKGDRVIACDSTPIRELIRRNIFAFQGRDDEAGRWWTLARSVLVDRGNPFAQRPRECRFERSTGSQYTVALDWRATNANFEAWVDASYNGDALPIGLTEPRAGVNWIAMPTFMPNPEQQARYRALLNTLAGQRAELAQARAVVFDLRHNQGGSGAWSRDIAQVLWGTDEVERRMAAYFAGVEVWWRASQGNTAHVERIATTLREQGRIELADDLQRLGRDMHAAMRSGERFVVRRNETQGSKADAALPATRPLSFAAPVYVIVPGQCASACLDAIDLFKRFPNVKLIGAPSSADTTYMEIRTEALASGMAAVIIPCKVWVGRPRGSGETYRPDIEVASIDWSTQTFLNAIDADLRR